MNELLTRQTLFAVLSAMECDLRGLVQLMRDEGGSRLLSDDMARRTRALFSKEHDPGEEHPGLEQLLQYLHVGDLIQIARGHSAFCPPAVAKGLREARLEGLVPVRNRVAHNRPLEAEDLPQTVDAARHLAKTGDHWPELNRTLKLLSDQPAFVLGLELPSFDSAAVSHNLPAPDFDETGFLGRDAQVRQLTAMLMTGAYPVISIVGDGGLGKTALALKVAYGILDDPSCPFEGIVWTSSKTTQLTAREIVRIQGAICDSLGMFRSMAEYLAEGGNVADPLEDVLEYLKAFRLLLIMDNLETVLDDRIKGFLERLPTGSRILITSRIGLGAFEYPFRLSPMTRGESVKLLRALAKARGLSQIATLPPNDIDRYCKKMHDSPGYMKWFVTAVQAGTRPEDVLANSSIFLDFCMSNVYEYLSKDSRSVLSAVQGLPGPHTQAELAFLSNLEGVALQRVLAELLRTNMVSLVTVPSGVSPESQYDLSEMARAYLARHHPVPRDQTRTLLNKRRQLSSMVEQINNEQARNPYSREYITVRSRSNLIVAKYLMEALEHIGKGDLDSAEALVERARQLTPQYFEVDRVAARIHAERGNLMAARSAFEAAIDLAPGEAPLRLWFGKFLVHLLKEHHEALKEFEEARRLDPAAVEPELSIARIYINLRQFDQAEGFVERLTSRSGLGTLALRPIHDLKLDYFGQRANHMFEQRDYAGSLYCLEKLKRASSSCPDGMVDHRMSYRFKKAKATADRLADVLAPERDQARARALAAWFASQAGARSKAATRKRARDGREVKERP